MSYINYLPRLYPRRMRRRRQLPRRQSLSIHHTSLLHAPRCVSSTFRYFLFPFRPDLLIRINPQNQMGHSHVLILRLVVHEAQVSLDTAFGNALHHGIRLPSVCLFVDPTLGNSRLYWWTRDACRFG